MVVHDQRTKRVIPVTLRPLEFTSMTHRESITQVGHNDSQTLKEKMNLLVVRTPKTRERKDQIEKKRRDMDRE